jgi:hypothetical protein
MTLTPETVNAAIAALSEVNLYDDWDMKINVALTACSKMNESAIDSDVEAVKRALGKFHEAKTKQNKKDKRQLLATSFNMLEEHVRVLALHLKK